MFFNSIILERKIEKNYWSYFLAWYAKNKHLLTTKQKIRPTLKTIPSKKEFLIFHTQKPLVIR